MTPPKGKGRQTKSKNPVVKGGEKRGRGNQSRGGRGGGKKPKNQEGSGQAKKRSRFEASTPEEDSPPPDKSAPISDEDVDPGEDSPPKEKSASDEDVDEETYEDTTDPKLVIGPVLNLVAPKLKSAWAINKKNKMSLIFDVVSPVRQFKRDTLYDEDEENPYADYEPSQEEDPNVTETDDDCDLQPYSPIVHA
jgi:hypothetical protein